MKLESTDSRNTSRWFLFAGAGVFVTALIYYALFRTQLPWPGHLIDLEWAPLVHFAGNGLAAHYVVDLTAGSYPSFAFALSMGLIAIGLFAFQRATAVKAILGIWLIGLAHEIFVSVLTVTDVLAGTLGAAIALRIALSVIRQPVRSVAGRKPIAGQAAAQRAAAGSSNRKDQIKLALLMLSSVAFATGTSPYEERTSSNCIETDESGTCVRTSTLRSPVYMSYTDLRNAVKFAEPRTLTAVNRIYLYKSYIFANELNEGIHIIDNSLPSSPERIGFIEIPGNQDIAVRDDALYADSYIDLITIDVSDMNNIREIARVEDIFPYNSRQNIPDNVRLSGTIDRTRGVVVGYR